MCKLRNWKVWGVLGLLLALGLMIGYGQELLPVPPPPSPLAVRIPPEIDGITGLINDAISFYSSILRGTSINVTNAAWWGSAGQKQLLIVAPAAQLILRPGAIVGLLGVHNLGALPTNFYVLRLGDRLDAVLIVDIRDIPIAALPIKIPPAPLTAAATVVSPPAHIYTWQEGPGQPLKKSACIGYHEKDCDCWGIYIEW